jgi:hypothetical protein
MKNSRSNNLDVTFVSTVPGLTQVEDCLPKPMQQFIPNWWKNMPNTFPSGSNFETLLTEFPTVKSCPSFIDLFSQGYVLPMWVDTVLSYDKTSDQWKWSTAGGPFTWEMHDKQQFVSHTNPIYQGNLGYAIFKAMSPWRIITNPGVSVLQLPVFYDFNSDFSVLPGILRTDVWHQINQQVLFHSDKKEISIPRGTPLAYYFPFYREQSKLTYREQTQQDQLSFYASDLQVDTKSNFRRGKTYLKLKSRRTKND